ncbi:hypothetical protein SPRG_04092 [Saprolegnia parasitica CBS 223.65]|uniref:Glycosyltransferase 61 catalytic domain-containing protein n=1 Tax=Saprolegnia parasitica (strain CBS 223.65) TaxID=695850 RepID=A0A067CXE0_SAPPC|nr:hypothetical protein SPRG_04092 [Saprolegnia parasitica CBS 223.65]KDO31477.1 hypothetical protein SPRG_04092 [Saprolegnia parasitica CBS 223.65]|eukprot:XP_012198070.1 hypothetical protein SPRG_04092 [Saprolegnia parasitica CBS 223.65]
MLRHLSLSAYLWTFGAYLVVWVALSISILHMLEVDYSSSFFAPKTPAPKMRPYHERRNISVDDAFLELYNFSNCYRQVDYGIVDAIQAKELCGRDDGTSITHLPGDGLWTDGSVWRNFGLDMRDATAMALVKNPIEDDDGYDPRYKAQSSRVMCNDCLLQDVSSLLAHVFPQHVNESAPEWRCERGDYDTQIEERAIVVARKNAMSPYYLLSAAINAWVIATQQLQWSPSTTRVVFLDNAERMEYDSIFQKLLSPAHDVVYGKDLVGKRVGFLKDALFVPFEHFGPLTQHLDDDQPCFESYLLQDFRDAVFDAFKVPRIAHNPVHDATRPCVVTIVSRRPIRGRDVNRMWANEDDVLRAMQDKYGRHCRFQAVDFATKSMADQIALIAESRVIIGMHGAGLANVLFAAAHAYVIEIFPLLTEKFGYRNLCQYLGLEYVAVRDGFDTIWPTQHKTIALDEWFRTFDLVMDVVLHAQTKTAYEQRKAIQRKIHRQHILDVEFPDL